MNSKDLLNLQEAYLDVYEGKVPWNDPRYPLQSGWTPAEKNREKRKRTKVEDPNTMQADISDRDMARYASMKDVDETETRRAPKGKKKTLFSKEQPPEHENLHNFKKDRQLDLSRTDNEYGMNRSGKYGGNATRGQARRAVADAFRGRREGDDNIFPTPIKQGDTRKRTSRRWGGPNPRNEEFDIHADIIIDHLIDEGYANTDDAALVIMANMSEEWAQDIINEVLDTPGRMINYIIQSGESALRARNSKDKQTYDKRLRGLRRADKRAQERRKSQQTK